MSKKKMELPIVEPIYSTFHNQCGTAIIHSNPSIRNWYLNESLMLKCSRRFLSGYSAPEVDIDNSALYRSPCFERLWFDIRFLQGYVNPMIRNMIDQGYYAFIDGIDDYYIEGKTWYKQRHLIHDGLICGYDQENKTYTIYAYDSNWVCRKFNTSQQGFNAGRRSAAKSKNGGICAIKPKPDIIEFDPNRVIQNISEYLDSSLDKYPVSGEGDIYGIVVHDYIAMYLDKLIDGSVPYERMDYRVFRMIWEQKKLMLERLIKFEEFLNWGNEASEKYKKVVNDADSIRMLYASHHMKRRDSLLPVIKKKLMILKDEEYEILEKCVGKAKGELISGTMELHKGNDA